VIELDRDLAARWRQRPGVTVVEADVLQVDFTALADAAGAPLRVVGNLPYNISTPILFHCCRWRPGWSTSTSCCRRRWSTAWPPAPGGKDYGRLSVMLQWRYASTRCSTCRPRPSTRRRG
jgi:16S rRNA (adenine1518-N6/adenine1519-N6)-dimethyltransferase